MTLSRPFEAGFKVEIVADSLSPAGTRLVTWKLQYPRFIHSELMTHRVMSRNSASSRAVPVSKILKQVLTDPATPIFWGANQKGMQAKAELRGWRRWVAQRLWYGARYPCVAAAWLLDKLGLHKQLANRILEPWMWMVTVVSATEHQNFFALRDHPDAQPEFRHLARLMRTEYDIHLPTPLEIGEWHLPFVTEEERRTRSTPECMGISVGRCAGASYYRADTDKDADAAIRLHDRLRSAKPPHMSPFEHVAHATPVRATDGNFEGFVQYRKLIPGESGRTKE